MFTEPALRSAASEARRHGWSPVFTAAHPTSGTSGSGGNVVLTRKGTGIAAMERVGVRTATQHRLAVAWVDAVVRGGLYCASVYLRHSEGMSEANQAILEEVAVALQCLGGPWIVAGDWNLSPSVLAHSRWPEMVDGVIFATELPTCNESVYDYFVVHRSLARAVVGVQRLQDSGLNPHWASRLLLRGDARRYAVRELVKPRKVEAVLPFGPAQSPLDYSQVKQLAGEPGQLERAMAEWYTLARLEWSQLAGVELHYSPARFRWRCPVTRVLQPWAGTSRASNMWRVLSRQAAEMASILSRLPSGLPLPDSCAQLLQVAERAPDSLCRSQRKEFQQPVAAWVDALRAACLARNGRWLLSLKVIADIKAKKLEDAAAALRIQQWRIAIGARSAEPGAAAAPTKCAYRWMKAIAGWTPSPVGPITANEAVPPDPDDHGSCWDFSDSIATTAPVDACSVPLSDQAVVEQEAEVWAELWMEGSQYVEPAFQMEEAALADLLPAALVTAASTFPLGTGLGCDNIAPRAFARLSAGALLALSALFLAFERQGAWCTAVNLVLIVLLPKPDGGFRPIGLFPTVIRLWMRARISLARAWESAHRLPCIFGGVGSSARAAAWQAAFLAESAALSARARSQALLDLVKAFETVPSLC